MEIDASTKVARHCAKRQAAAACEDGGPEGRAIRFDGCEHTVCEGKTSGNGSEETDRTARLDQIHNADLLEHMTLALSQTLQSLGRQMQAVPCRDGFATESCRRQQDYKKMEAAMTAKMEEGFRNEEQAGQQTQKQIVAGLKNDANDRQMVQNDLQAIKDAAALLAVMSVRLLEEGQVVRSQDRRKEWPLGSTTCSCHDEWSLKVGSRTTSSAGTKGSQTQRIRISSMICTRWYLMRSKNTLIGSKPGTNKERGQPRLWQVCGSATRPIC